MMRDDDEPIHTEHVFARGDRVRHVGSNPGTIAIVVSVDPALDPDFDLVRITYEFEGKRSESELHAWRLRKVPE